MAAPGSGFRDDDTGLVVFLEQPENMTSRKMKVKEDFMRNDKRKIRLVNI